MERLGLELSLPDVIEIKLAHSLNIGILITIQRIAFVRPIGQSIFEIEDRNASWRVQALKESHRACTDKFIVGTQSIYLRIID
jgi:hypothetical protein